MLIGMVHPKRIIILWSFVWLVVSCWWGKGYSLLDIVSVPLLQCTFSIPLPQFTCSEDPCQLSNSLYLGWNVHGNCRRNTWLMTSLSQYLIMPVVLLFFSCSNKNEDWWNENYGKISNEAVACVSRYLWIVSYN